MNTFGSSFPTMLVASKNSEAVHVNSNARRKPRAPQGEAMLPPCGEEPEEDCGRGK